MIVSPLPHVFIYILFVIPTFSLPTLRTRQESFPDGDECPETWNFDLVSFSGPGCPDSSPSYNRTGYSGTYPTWGSHFVPGCHTPWAWFQFLWMQASLGSTGLDGVGTKTWCEMKIKYTEMKGTFGAYPVPKGQEKFRLKLHRNGTSLEASYGLDEGTQAIWKVTYYPTEVGITELVDQISISGPVYNGTGVVSRLDWITKDAESVQWSPSQCGPATFSMRVDLEIKAEKEGAKGIVVSKKGMSERDRWMGAVLGVSHDFEPCNR